MLEGKKMTQCQFPGCKLKATKTWALVDLCEEHYVDVKVETQQYYGQKTGMFRIPYDERTYFHRISHLIPWRMKAIDIVKLGRKQKI
jgi:hypothetical protein